MSRQSKNARNKAKAKEITSLHANGGKGPAKTMPNHGKKWTYRQNPDVKKRLDEQAKAAGPVSAKDKTSGKKILAKAGGASKTVNKVSKQGLTAV